MIIARGPSGGTSISNSVALARIVVAEAMIAMASEASIDKNRGSNRDRDHGRP
jgi:hypothetical protein